MWLCPRADSLIGGHLYAPGRGFYMRVTGIGSDRWGPLEGLSLRAFHEGERVSWKTVPLRGSSGVASL